MALTPKGNNALIAQILALPEVAALQCSSAAVLANGSSTKPDLFLLNFDGEQAPVVFKTYALKTAFVRATAGWFVTRREHTMLKRLEGIEGIERTACPPSRCGLFVKWISGKPLNKVNRESLSEETFKTLTTIVEQMHQAGVVHLDIAHKGNIRVTADGRPILIDFQSALYVKNWPEWLKKWFWKIDDITVLKWKKKLFPHLLTPEEERAYEQRKKLARWWPWSHGDSKRHKVSAN